MWDEQQNHQWEEVVDVSLGFTRVTRAQTNTDYCNGRDRAGSDLLLCQRNPKRSLCTKRKWRILKGTRPCLNELQKEYCVKTKVIALD